MQIQLHHLCIHIPLLLPINISPSQMLEQTQEQSSPWLMLLSLSPDGRTDTRAGCSDVDWSHRGLRPLPQQWGASFCPLGGDHWSIISIYKFSSIWLYAVQYFQSNWFREASCFSPFSPGLELLWIFLFLLHHNDNHRVWWFDSNCLRFISFPLK